MKEHFYICSFWFIASNKQSHTHTHKVSMWNYFRSTCARVKTIFCFSWVLPLVVLFFSDFCFCLNDIFLNVDVCVCVGGWWDVWLGHLAVFLSFWNANRAWPKFFCTILFNTLEISYWRDVWRELLLRTWSDSTKSIGCTQITWSKSIKEEEFFSSFPSIYYFKRNLTLIFKLDCLVSCFNLCDL